MLKKIRLTDFKSFVDEEAELAPLTLLVGANASGKSNFLDAIRFLQGLSEGLTLSEVLNGEERAHPGAWPGLRGRMEESARLGKSAFTVESLWLTPIGNERASQEIRHRIECRTSPLLGRRLEWVEGGGRRIVAPATLDQQKSLITNFDDVPKSERGIPLALLIAIQDVRFLDIQPSAMRDYGRRSAPLGNEGKNLSGVLADLSDDPIVKHSFVAWLREVCAPEIEDLDFVEVKEFGHVMAIFVEKSGVRISAQSISDGTLRFLGTLLALRTARPGDILLIEEIEEGLHPSRIHFLLELLESAVRQQGIQVIATTHSPVVLQWLAPERLREVLVFGRVPGRPGSLIRRLGEIPYFEEVIQREGIDELFSTGWLEMAL
jgi:predicted ATPase